MGKHEQNPFRMVIEGGRLVPTNPYDAERLDTYRRGTEVRVTFTEDKDRPLLRKWWMILGLVVKQCDVPWQNKEQASEAIKLAIGIVNYSKTVSGKFMAYPKSLTELTDPELEEAVEQMMALIQRMTGIDPATLKKEAKVEDDHEPSGDSHPPDDGSGDSSTPPEEPAADQSAQESGTEAGASTDDNDEGQHSAEPAPASASERTPQECLDAFMKTASDSDISVQERRKLLETMKDWWKEALPDQLDFVRSCLQMADKAAKGEMSADKAREYLEGLING